MQVHASCAARRGAGVLLMGEPGSGKSDLLLRLLDRGWDLVADDQVVIRDGMASAPGPLAGLMEVRGLGILRLPFAAAARLVLAVRMGSGAARLPEPERAHGLPLIRLDPFQASAPFRVDAALRCVLGEVALDVGAFA